MILWNPLHLISELTSSLLGFFISFQLCANILTKPRCFLLLHVARQMRHTYSTRIFPVGEHAQDEANHAYVLHIRRWLTVAGLCPFLPTLGLFPFSPLIPHLLPCRPM